jgi:glucose-6-phosphate isomerase
LISSKTFTTQETITNALSARCWFLKKATCEKDVEKNFVAISSNRNAVHDFGINTDNMFEFWDWVGGRYSMWSAVGLPIMLSIGSENFDRLLDGAHSMDNHFYEKSFDSNIPVILALISVWYSNFFGSETEAVFPYDQYMHRFCAYLQQLNMESNGKSIDRNGFPISYETGPIIWGEPGTNGQHAFYQLIHQGTKLIPCDFISSVETQNKIGDHHEKLLSNFLAQTQALAFGRLESSHIEPNERIDLTYDVKNFKIFRGNQPTNSIILKRIDPYNLGALIAMYEHKTFVQGVVLNIFSFDQWGVELGKKLAENILPELSKDSITTSYDSSTNGLINRCKDWRSV